MSVCLYDTDRDVYLKSNQLVNHSESILNLLYISELSGVTD